VAVLPDSKNSCIFRVHEKFTSEIQLNPTKRLARLEYLRTQLACGVDVAKRDLKNVLTESEWQSYEERRRNELENRKPELPAKLKKYAAMKKSADLAFARFQAHYTKDRINFDKVKNHRLYEKHDHLVERALEYLNESLGQNRGLMAWLYAEEPHGDVDEAIAAMVLPKLVTTRTNLHAASSPEPKLSIRNMKLDAIESAIYSLSPEAPQEFDLPKVSASKKFDFSKIKV